MDLRTLMLLKSAGGGGGGGELVVKSAEGTVVQFETNVRKNLTWFAIRLMPVQEGSGTPGPDHVLPVTGYTGITVYRSGEDTEHPDAFPISFPESEGIVYGAELNVLTGELAVTYMSYTFTGAPEDKLVFDSTLTLRGVERHLFKTDIFDYFVARGAVTSIYASAAVRSVESTAEDPLAFYSGNPKNQMLLYILPSLCEGNAESFNAWLAEHPCQFVMPLAEPYVVQLDPVTVRTLVGTNKIWNDKGQPCAVAYLKRVWRFSEDELDVGYISSDGVWHRTTSNNQVSTVGYLDHSVRSLESDGDHYFSLYRYDRELTFVDRIVNLRSYAELDFDQYEYRFVLKRNDGSYFEKAEAAASLAYEK